MRTATLALIACVLPALACGDAEDLTQDLVGDAVAVARNAGTPTSTTAVAQGVAKPVPFDIPALAPTGPGDLDESRFDFVPSVGAITNPTSGAVLPVYLWTPEGSGPWPTLVIQAGGTAGSQSPLRRTQPFHEAGFAVVSFDPDGRGRPRPHGAKRGEEDFNGLVHQDAMAAVIRHAATLDGVDPDRIGVVSLSYGITMAAGALGRHHDTPAKFLVDRKRPADRTFTTGCGRWDHLHKIPTKMVWGECSDDAWWEDREAVKHIGSMQVPYVRFQAKKDHVQPDHEHAAMLVNLAIEGGVPYARLNDMTPNQRIEDHTKLRLHTEEKEMHQLLWVARYAAEMMEQTTGRPVKPATWREVPARAPGPPRDAHKGSKGPGPRPAHPKHGGR